MFERKVSTWPLMVCIAFGLLCCSQGTARDRSNVRIPESHRIVKENKRAGAQEVEALKRPHVPVESGRTASTGFVARSKVKDEVEISGDIGGAVVTTSVSGYASGKDIGPGKTFFADKTVAADGGKMRMKLTDFPAFLESKEAIEGSISYEDSPFGISGIDGYDPLLRELGIFWVRYMGAAGIVWDAVEPRRGVFHWHRNDIIYAETYNNNVHMVVTILTPNRWDQGMGYGRPRHRFPVHVESYKEFLRRLVERYDGDGIDDAPGSPVINHWQIENEGDFFWEDTPENYARLVKISYNVIKKQNPDAKVLLSGVATPKGFYDFYVPVLKYLKSMRENPTDRSFDIFDFHWVMGGSGRYKRAPFAGAGTTDLRECIESIRDTLTQYGYRVPIWITETASHSGMPRRGLRVPFETERDQAAELIKRMIYPLSLGVQKVFWSTLVEMHGFGDQTGTNDYFDLIGLVHNPRNAGLSHKKLAFYAYKKLVDKLQGVEPNRVESLSDQENNHIYRFSDGNGFVYVLWRF